MTVIDLIDLRTFDKNTSGDRVWLMSTIKREEGASGIGWHQYQITLTHAAEIGTLRLFECVTLQAMNGQLWTDKEKRIAEEWEFYEQLIRAALEAKGYTVQQGAIAIPKDLKPIRGSFGVAEWDNEDLKWKPT